MLDGFKESSVNPCRILSANEFAPTEKSNFTQTGYTQMIKEKVGIVCHVPYIRLTVIPDYGQGKSIPGALR